MTDKHTPGPWTINGGRIEATGAGTSAAVVVARVGLNNDQSREDTANARLIAAAPELLEALIDLDKVFDFSQRLDPGDFDIEDHAFSSAAFIQARAAIQAARKS